MIHPDRITGGYITTYDLVRDLVLLGRQIARVEVYPASPERDAVLEALEAVLRQRSAALRN